MRTLFSLCLLLFCAVSFAQTNVTGKVVDENDQPIPGANIKLTGQAVGAVTDFDGNFSLKVDQNPPFELQVSSIGFATQKVQITQNNQNVTVKLEEDVALLDEIVVSASRTPERLFESPVTVERVGVTEIKNSTSANFYDGLENLKGVDLNTGSLTFKSVNTRGFATFANTRFVQLVDGIDNSSPALNFVIGNLVGMNELDVNSIELLPGASSALYGANAFNGILFMTSKNPFDHEGIRAYAKTGITSSEDAGDNNFYDFGIRAAKKFSEKLAGKANFSYLQGTDWFATDDRQYSDARTRIGEPDEIINKSADRLDHDGLNIYGDEITTAAAGTDLRGVAQQLETMGLIPAGASALIPAVNVGRTGYREQDLTDYEARSIKFDAALHYRPFANDIEVILTTRLGKGNTIYQGANRYQLKNFIVQQHKVEVKGDNFFVRGYRTTEDAKDSYDLRFTGINMNRVNATEWFGTYAGAYLQSTLAGATDADSHAAARIAADNAFTPQPGTPEFQRLFDQVTSDPDISTGSKFLDNTSLNHAEGNYNFSSLLNDAADVQVGASYRQYSLNSQGTIFTDFDGPIEYSEYGAYVQGVKKFLEDDRLRVTASMRYDKNEFFDGNISPRLSLGYSAGENKQHNIRASFQTGFRNPDTQSLFIGFDVGRATLVGSSPDNLDRRLPNTDLVGRDVYFDSYSLNSVQDFSTAVAAAVPGILAANPGISLEQAQGLAVQQNAGVLSPETTGLVQPEKVTAFDIGYRGKLGNSTSVDVNAYYNIYDGFINQRNVVTPVSGSTTDATGVADIATGNFQVFQTYTNSLADVSSYGLIFGVNTKLLDKFDVGVNYTLAKFDFDQESDPGFSAGFNTPEHKVKFSLGSTNLFDNFGFGINARWSDEYFWQASIANAVIPSRTLLDAQINYSVPSIKSLFKVGGSNILGDEYITAPGSGNVGSQFFISWTINNL
ncbi:TonB-dependent receptor [Spongiivirga citrea]|uniref:TonB-dependent receptor plug domain-containing protein n=1 Tax=Spongiivirga citrea TaxID=1481457 RepID=A0A6M0CJE7_9FLAO|nr:carboxypeptidase-like regulatory domain-containing protein [Spongiivirga citrea]NER17103.1 TonB-dependent receptor plug domain-containing protein [Spongiivirga citrea]